MGYKNNDNSDSKGLLTRLGTNNWERARKKDIAHDQWDIIYGDGINAYVVYVLTDGWKPIKLQFGLLTFYHEPFYVGYGNIKKRIGESSRVGRQKDKYLEKTFRLMQITEAMVRAVHIGHFQTLEKAKLVERKVIYTINKSYLTNAQYNFTELPLVESDCNVMIECEYNGPPLKGPLKC